jgi:predicted dehydrogenase
VDDNAQVLIRFRGGARGMLWASQVAPGNENALRLRVYGELGSLVWEQEEPNRLLFSRYGRPTERITRGGPGLGKAATSATRIPSGHPEGYLEVFANIYRDFSDLLTAWPYNPPELNRSPLPGVTDGARAVQFMSAAVQSSRSGATWVGLSL